MNIALSTDMNLIFGVVHAEDDIVFKDDEESASSQVDTDYLWVGMEWLPSKTARGRLTLSWLDFEREKIQGSFEMEDEDEDKGGVLDHRQDIQRLAIRNDYSMLYAGKFLELGRQAEYNKGKYRHKSLIDRGELADIIGTQREVKRDIYLKPDGWSGGVYLQAEWEVTPRFLVQPSLRWDYQNYYLDSGSEQQFSPRLGLAYELNEETRLRLSLGRFHQPESIQELQVLDGVTRFFPPQYPDQVVAGLEWQRDKFRFVGELYYKRYDKQKGRFENMFNPFVLLPEMEPDRVGLLPSKALAQGLDLDLRYEFLPHMSGSFRYSYMDADDRINGRWIPRRWSQQHTVNAGIIWQKDTFSLSLALTWHSGWRSSQLPPVVPEDRVIPIESVLNNVELSDYFSLDVSARKFWEIGRTRLQIYADISNLTDRSNAAGIDYDVEEIDGGFALIPDHENLLKRVPSVGITLSF
jgi:outer membrane receptor protein involved in Fe transport